MNGSGKEEHLIQELMSLRELSKSDFLAFARPVQHERYMHWQVILGSRNGRVRQMTIKPGIGIGGMVLRHGTIYRADDSENSAMLLECPVMLAEKLTQGAAFPVTARLGGSTSILLIGRRGGLKYEEPELQSVHSFLQQIKAEVDEESQCK